MPIFKPKASKQIVVSANSTVTLDSKHSSMCEGFATDKIEIQRLTNRRRKLKKLLNNTTDVVNQLVLTDQIDKATTTIKALKAREKSYYLENSKYVFDYFEEKKNISNQNDKDDEGKRPTEGNRRVANFFKIENSDDDSHMHHPESGPSHVKKYLANVDETFIDVSSFVVQTDICPKCHQGELIPVDNEGIMLCNKCFKTFPVLIENEKPSYKEPPKEVCFYAYKRINHFREILAQFQAKETTQIPDEVLNNIKRQITKERISVSALTNRKAKEILKKLGYNKYYEHIPFIKDKLGVRPPIMSADLEEKLCSLFMDIQGPYAKHCPENRVNFLNYYYTVYKLCELLDERRFLPFFPMLKDMGKRIEQDAIWKQICSDLNWEFIPTQ